MRPTNICTAAGEEAGERAAWFACDHPEREPDEHTLWHTMWMAGWDDELPVCRPCAIAVQAAAATGRIPDCHDPELLVASVAGHWADGTPVGLRDLL